MWMNEHDVNDAVDYFDDDEYLPNLFRAARILQALMRWTNRHSDGWPYWSKPSNAASKLQTLLQEHMYTYRRGQEVTDATDAELRSALSPIKAFLTKQAKERDHQGGFRVTPGERDDILNAGIPKPPTTNEIIAKITQDAGLPVMAQVLHILVDRERRGAEEYVRGLDAEDVEFLYANHIGPAIDKIEDSEITP